MEEFRKIIEFLVWTPVGGGFWRFLGCLFIYPIVAMMLAAPLIGLHKLITIIKN